MVLWEVLRLPDRWREIVKACQVSVTGFTIINRGLHGAKRKLTQEVKQVVAFLMTLLAGLCIIAQSSHPVHTQGPIVGGREWATG